MKALSLWQPWASLVADERKRIETRSWRPPQWLVGQTIAIHATQKVDREAAEDFGYEPEAIPRGAIVATARLDSWIQFTEENTEHISDEEKRFGDFYPGRFGWILTDVQKLKAPAIVRGHQGIFDWDAKAKDSAGAKL